MKKGLTRRDFFRRIGVGTIGLGFGVSIFDGIYQYADALTDEEAHSLLMKGTVNFMGFMAKRLHQTMNSISRRTPRRSLLSTRIRLH